MRCFKLSRWRTALLMLASVAMLTFVAGSALGAQAPVPLGNADSFAVLSATGITNVGATTVNDGNIGSSLAIGGGITVNNGVNHGNDGVTALAQASLVAASALATPTGAIVADLGGQTLGPGVYDSAVSIGITGPAALTLNGSPSDVFIFQTGDQLQVNPTAQVNLTGGAQACNVFWQVATLANLNNSGFKFVGTIIAGTSITVSNNVTVDGRLLAKTGNVTFINDVVNRPTCAAAPAAPVAPPARALYCDPHPDANGWTQSYALEKGQDKLPPYAALGLISAYVDPITGAESCNFPTTAPVATTPTPVPVPTPVPTPPVTTPPVATPPVATPPVATPPVATPVATPPVTTPPTTPAPKPTPAPAPKVKPATKVVAAAKRTYAKPARHHAAFTG